MRGLFRGACLIVVATSCRSSCGGSSAADAGPAQSPSATPSTSASAAAGPFKVMGKCDPRRQAAVCSADGKQQLSCGLGTLITVQICDGPAGCKGSGDDLVCDVMPAKAGEPCAMGVSPPRCNSPHELMQCNHGKWVSLMCSPPGTCRPPTSDMPSSCR